jgi:hypothetical protein
LLGTIAREILPGKCYLYTRNAPFEEGSMLDSAKLMGFVPTKDYEQARAFYEGKLGCEFVSLDQFALVMRVGGHMIRIVKIPNFTPLQRMLTTKGKDLGREIPGDLAGFATFW